MLDKDLKKLEELVKKAEGDDLGLEESLKIFEEGMRLVKSAQKSVEEAELKVKEISEKSLGEFIESPVAADE